MAIGIQINLTGFLNSLRQYNAPARMQQVAEDMDVREKIAWDIYSSDVLQPPVDTGALRDSPIQGDGMASYPKGRYSYGHINTVDIYYDPIQTSKSGKEFHYANYAGWNPYTDIYSGFDIIREIVAQNLVIGYRDMEGL